MRKTYIRTAYLVDSIESGPSWQSGGREFDPRQLHHNLSIINILIDAHFHSHCVPAFGCAWVAFLSARSLKGIFPAESEIPAQDREINVPEAVSGPLAPVIGDKRNFRLQQIRKATKIAPLLVSYASLRTCSASLPRGTWARATK
jgi:hypothetical protein